MIIQSCIKNWSHCLIIAKWWFYRFLIVFRRRGHLRYIGNIATLYIILKKIELNSTESTNYSVKRSPLLALKLNLRMLHIKQRSTYSDQYRLICISTLPFFHLFLYLAFRTCPPPYVVPLTVHSPFILVSTPLENAEITPPLENPEITPLDNQLNLYLGQVILLLPI